MSGRLFLGGHSYGGRQASMFGVNPLGVQMDGTLVENNQARGGGSGGQGSREVPDLSPDFVFQSKGRITPYGYELEIRVPFKSIKYQSADIPRIHVSAVRGAGRTWLRVLANHVDADEVMRVAPAMTWALVTTIPWRTTHPDPWIPSPQAVPSTFTTRLTRSRLPRSATDES